MTKAELRKKYKALRNNLSVNDVEDLSIKITNQLLKLNVWEHSFYHTFLTIKEQKEVNTIYLLSVLSGKDKNILVPKSDFELGNMKHFLLTDDTKIKKNKHNICEPINGIEVLEDKINVVFIPLLAYDKKGNRVGYGKGFYDRFLKKCNPETIKIGLSFFDAENDIIDVFDGDIKLNYCLSPDQIYKF